ncbi:ABC transporter substrate-binding protein [Deinococcus radiodurans]|jgi:ABC-type dipeptide transport system, periplasmic component|uniref:ABC transporter substrate-binding protein n=1 Tax=Deinococcus radiodurans TaxID=1299 RepID=UPI000482A5DE|nr:ABC transporter substrate-binding protein [Deinococcus radiodurans]ANC73059.1 ABC transporter substrate-binding protein [Deinococcus radiodurans R1 = ATCC 13939 = DSM 20539]QEM73014.1 ABC transporter substrate-binding protein [Deinococcus radiodurans]QIP30306.1 ABC transporter substrate-binding protein [Deinococcus radiodurans]QIP33337.1 ABC transporter substrate-binding protein [Deinococcus radiodurans]UDL01980.1 ABC transporter substrate-binding protein [Deinococcus radiodurans R1 = ATCC 
MLKRSALTLISLALLGGGLNQAFAAPKKVSGYGSLGVTNGKPGGSFTLALGDSPQSLFYYGAIDNNLGLISQQLFDGLVEFNLATYKLEPALAESWAVSNGGKTYTFKLRQGVKWSDGQTFNADDVVFTYKNFIMNPEARAGDAGNFKLDGQPVTIKKVNDYTVQFDLPRPAPAFLLQQRYFIMPQHKLAKFTGADVNKAWPTNVDESEVVGTGPFKLSKYTAGQKVTLVKNPNYWKVDAAGTKLPYLNSLEFLILRDPQAQVSQFLAGNLDQLNISGAQFPDLKSKEVAGGKFKVIRSTALFGSPPFVAYNFDAADPALAKLFSDVRFRRAMQSALNRRRIIDTVYNELASLPGHGVAPANKAFYANTTRQLGTFDLAAANKALDALGLNKKNSAGIRLMSNGKPLEFDLTYGTDSPVYPPMAAIIQSDFAKVGVKVNLKGILSSKLLSTGQSGNWEMILHAFGDQPDPELRRPIWQPGGALYYWHRSLMPAKDGDKPNLAKMFPWEKEIYTIFDDASTTPDVGKRKALYTRWQLNFAQNLPVTPIAKPENIGAISDKYGNYVYNLGVIPGYNPVPLIFQK